MARLLVCGGEAFRDRAELCDALDSIARSFQADCVAHRAAATVGGWIEDWARLRDLPALATAGGAADAGGLLDAAAPEVVVFFSGEGDGAGILGEARRREIAIHSFCIESWRAREAARRRHGLVPGETLLRSVEGLVGVFVEILSLPDDGPPTVAVNCLLPGGLRRNRPFRGGWRKIDAEGRPLDSAADGPQPEQAASAFACAVTSA